MNGIIPIYKPKDFTSFDVVAIMKRLCQTRKVGHGGTLDPMAKGVLPIFVGGATRAVDYSPDNTKEYIAGFQLGITTDTGDITGNVIFENNAYVSRNKLLVASRFLGEISQIPPMYSAVKVKGERLYNIARKLPPGEEIPRPSRKVFIHSISLEEYHNNIGVFKVSCSKGTYIRTLIQDIGKEIGSGAVMTSLIRTRSSGFGVDDCLQLLDLKDMPAENATSFIKENMFSLTDFFSVYPKAFLDSNQTRLFTSGASLLADRINFEKIYDGIYRIYSEEGYILALAKIQRDHTLEIVQRFSKGCK